MIKYVLKKDTPFYEKGTEFCEDWFHKGVLLNDDCNAVANLNELDNPDEWFEEVKESDPLFEELTHDDQRDRVAVNIWFRKDRDGSHPKEMVDFIQFMEAINVVSQDEGFMRKNGGGFGWPVIEYTTNNPGVDDIAERQHAGEFYFDTREHALNSAMNHTGEWQTILNYDWSRE